MVVMAGRGLEMGRKRRGRGRRASLVMMLVVETIVPGGGGGGEGSLKWW